MASKEAVQRECDRLNRPRKVRDINMTQEQFLSKVHGDLLVSGQGACCEDIVLKTLYHYHARKDMPTIVLTSHRNNVNAVKCLCGQGELEGCAVTGRDNRNYHPMYGMNTQQISELIRQAALEVGCQGIMDKLLLYAMAAINVVSCYYPVSLQALSHMLDNSDYAIAQLAQEKGLSESVINDITGNCEAGIMLRRVIGRMEETFSEVTKRECDTRYNFQTGALRGARMMVFYQPSRNQKLMNAYLKEEIFGLLRKIHPVRIVLDEAIFTSEEDELLQYLFYLKQVEDIELVVFSEDAVKMLKNKENLNFSNSCLMNHATPFATEEVTQIYGKYKYHYPTVTISAPPTLFWTPLKGKNFTIAAEDRLRVRSEDLYQYDIWSGATHEKVAWKLKNDENVYFSRKNKFLVQIQSN